jgi:CheY-like chemotaxis protein
MHILVADPDLALLRDIAQALEQVGHRVTKAGDGMTAWGYLLGIKPPDLLVTGIYLGPQMPPGTALGFHASACTPRIPVLYLITGPEQAQLIDPDHGAVLLKPFLPASLTAIVHQLLIQRCS